MSLSPMESANWQESHNHIDQEPIRSDKKSISEINW